jgi:hypothetical protein
MFYDCRLDPASVIGWLMNMEQFIGIKIGRRN